MYQVQREEVCSGCGEWGCNDFYNTYESHELIEQCKDEIEMRERQDLADGITARYRIIKLRS